MDMISNIALIGVPMVVILVLAIIITGNVSKYLNTKKESVLESINNEKARMYVDLLWTTVETTVTALNQTMVDDMKTKSEDGKLTEEEAADIKETAIRMVLDTFSEDGKAFLSLLFDDLEEYVDTLIESAVRHVKQEIPLG